VSDRNALLAAVTDAPGDDTPRLVYADFLEEAGQGARAAVLRGQEPAGWGKAESERPHVIAVPVPGCRTVYVEFNVRVVTFTAPPGFRAGDLLQAQGRVNSLAVFGHAAGLVAFDGWDRDESGRLSLRFITRERPWNHVRTLSGEWVPVVGPDGNPPFRAADLSELFAECD